MAKRKTDNVTPGFRGSDLTSTGLEKFKKEDREKRKISNIRALYGTEGVLEAANIVIGTMAASSAIRAKGKFEEAAFIENARRLDLASEDAIKRGDKEATRYLQNVRKLVGAQRAALGAQGIEIDTGSAADIQAETLEFGFEDSATIRTNAFRESFGFRSQAIEARSQANLTRIGRKAEQRSTMLTGGLRLAQSATGTISNISNAGSA